MNPLGGIAVRKIVQAENVLRRSIFGGNVPRGNLRRGKNMVKKFILPIP